MSGAESARPPRRPYRRAYNSGTWHFTEHCPEWPLRDFVESDGPEFTKLCKTCHEVLTREPAPGDA
jgi:hypothetical protein